MVKYYRERELNAASQLIQFTRTTHKGKQILRCLRIDKRSSFLSPLTHKKLIIMYEECVATHSSTPVKFLFCIIIVAF